MNDDVTRKWRRRRRRLRRRVRRAAEVIGLLIFVVVVGSALLKNDKSSSPAPTTTTVPLGPERADVKVTSCRYRDNAALADLRITNHSDLRFNYAVTILFLDRGKLYAQGAATWDNLEGRQRVDVTATALRSVSPTALTCAIFKVQRFP